MLAAGLVVLLGGLGLGLHPLLHHPHDPAEQPCAVCVHLGANPAAPAAATELRTEWPAGPAPTAPPAGASACAVPATRSRAPPSAAPDS